MPFNRDIFNYSDAANYDILLWLAPSLTKYLFRSRKHFYNEVRLHVVK